LKFRNAIKAIFGGIKNYVTSAWREIGGYVSRFSSFGRDIYANEVVRACIRTLAEHTSKANVKVLRDGMPGDKKLQRMIQYRPNIYMNGKDFLYKVRTLLEINNVVFIYIMRDDFGKCIGLYPMPTAQLEAVEANGGLYIKFYFPSGTTMVHSWEDLAVLRKDYNTSDIWGDSNGAILTSLDLLNTTNEGMANAIKATANMRGLLKNTKAGLKPEDVKASRDVFVNDYMTLSNTSGVAALDAYQDFTPIKMEPVIANYKNVEELRNNIYRYFGVNEDAVLSKLSGDTWEAFYEAKIEPVLIALGLELTNKIFTDRERGFENEIMFESNRMQYMSTANKLALVQMVDRMAMTPNEWRQVMNMAPVPWGNEPQSWQNPKKEEKNADKTE
jgi:HK97 family phage portal protein